MRRQIVQLFTAAAFSIGVTLSGAAVAQADPIDCQAHFLDATAASGIDANFVNYAVGRLKEVAPTADVYVQAYQQTPGGSPDAFWELGKQQCANWLDPSGTRVGDNMVMVVYGSDVDDIGLYYGYNFDTLTMSQMETVMTGIRAKLGPNASQVNPNYTAEALYQALSDTRYHLMESRHFSHADGMYHPPVYVDPNSYHKDFSPVELVKWIVLTGAGSAAFGLVCWAPSGVARLLRRRSS
jgi:hypothetical protein